MPSARANSDRNATARANAQRGWACPLIIPLDDFLADLQPWRSMSDADLATLTEYAERELGEWTARHEEWLITRFALLLEGCHAEQQRRSTLSRARSIASPRFDADFVQRVKDAVPLWEYAGYCGLKVRRAGQGRYVAPCQWHPDKTPSLTFWDDHAFCFSCHWTGDIFTFIEQMTGDRTFVRAVEEAARYAGISMPNPQRVLPRVLDV
jgi:hypothetical protein